MRGWFSLFSLATNMLFNNAIHSRQHPFNRQFLCVCVCVLSHIFISITLTNDHKEAEHLLQNPNVFLLIYKTDDADVASLVVWEYKVLWGI